MAPPYGAARGDPRKDASNTRAALQAYGICKHTEETCTNSRQP